jgi:hypothetical protein
LERKGIRGGIMRIRRRISVKSGKTGSIIGEWKAWDV